jgi:hypothetical protein
MFPPTNVPGPRENEPEVIMMGSADAAAGTAQHSITANTSWSVFFMSPPLLQRGSADDPAGPSK